MLNPDESRVLLRYATATIPEIIWQYRTDNQIFHSLLMRGSATISATPFFIRFITATLFSVLTIPLLYRTALLLFNQYVALGSALLLACSTYHIYYAQDNRGYALIVFFSTLSTFILYKALFKNLPRYWLVFIITATLNVYTHLFTLGLVNAQILMVIWFWWYHRHATSFQYFFRSILSFIVIGLILCLLYGPLVKTIIYYSDHEQQSYGTEIHKFTEASLSHHLIDYSEALSKYIIYDESATIALVLLLLIIIAIKNLAIYQPFLAGWMIIWIFFPCLLALLALNTGPDFFIKLRFLQFVIPPLLILIVHGSLVSGQNLHKYSLISSSDLLKFAPSLLLISFVILLNTKSYKTINQNRLVNDWHQVVNFLNTNITPEDLILCQEYDGPNILFDKVKVDNECTWNIRARLRARGYHNIFVQKIALQKWDTLINSPWLNQPKRIWLIRWNIPSKLTTVYEPEFTARSDKIVDVIVSDSDMTLLDSALKIMMIRTTFQEKTLNKAMYWIELSRLQLLNGNFTAAKYSWQRATSYSINNPVFQSYLEQHQELLNDHRLKAGGFGED